MADEPDSGGFVCPNCNAPVEEDWAACPSCGIDFAGAEEEAPAPPPPPPKAPAVAAPPKAAPPPPARATPPPPPAKAAPPKAAKAPPPSKAAKPPAPPKAKKARPAGAGAGTGAPLVGPLIRRFGIVGFLGLGLAIFALIGYFVVMNYDTLLGGQSVNNIGDQQKGAMNVALMVFAAGAVVTVIGLFRARSVEMTPEAGGELAEAPAASPMESAGLGDVMVPLSAQIEEEVRAPPARAPPPATVRYAPPPPAPAPPPAPKPAVAAAPEIEEEEEEEVALDIPTTTRPPVAEVAVPASSAAAVASVGTSDELEDLFGELESEVQAAEAEEDVLYECPNCHGMVKEDDTSCPHCKVTFEG